MAIIRDKLLIISVIFVVNCIATKERKISLFLPATLTRHPRVNRHTILSPGEVIMSVIYQLASILSITEITGV